MFERVLHPQRDVRGLLLDRRHHAARVAVDAELRVRVPDVEDGLAHDARDVDVDLGGDLARDDHEPRCDQRLAGHTAAGIAGEDGVQDGVGDLVGDLVRMALRDRLGGEQKLARHGREGYLIVWKPEIRNASPSLTR